jgi:hypothetical protein
MRLVRRFDTCGMRRSEIRRSHKPIQRTPMARGRKRLNPVGKVGRRRIGVSRELTAEAKQNGHDFCELAPILREFGIDDSPCLGPLTNAHSVKTSARMEYHGAERERLERESARGCKRHHYFSTDLKDHETQAKIVRAAIARREL